MIICTKCSTSNADDDEFCGGCGEFLEWSGQKVAAAPAAASPSAPADGPPPTPPPPASPVPPPPAAPSTPPPTPPPPASPVPPAPAQPVQPQPVQPQPVQPAPVLPSKPVPQRAEPASAAKAEPALRPGESACPSCGAGNDSERSFCRRCGVSLAPEPEPEKKPGWFKKLITKEPPKPHAAGERPMRDKKGKTKP